MREHSPASVGVKAAGGVRTLDDVLRVRALGVSRIGATATESILEEAKKRGYAAVIVYVCCVLPDAGRPSALVSLSRLPRYAGPGRAALRLDGCAPPECLRLF